MPRPARPWFRFYVEACSDRKLRRLKPSQRWLWVAVLAAARQSPEPGVLWDGEIGEPMTDAALADFAGMTTREVTRTLPLFERSEMIEQHESGAWRVTNFGRRQFIESDVSTHRTRKHRSKEPDRNVPTNVPNPFPGTSENGSLERSPSRAPARAPAARSRPETETETEDLSSSDELTRGDDPPDDDDRPPAASDQAHETEPPPDQAERVGAAIAVLARRDLDARQTAAGQPPIGDATTWHNRAYDRRRAAHETHLRTLADQHPDHTPDQLADRIEPPPQASRATRHDPYDDPGWRTAERHRQLEGTAAMHQIANEPVAPDAIERLRAIRQETGLTAGPRPDDAA